MTNQTHPTYGFDTTGQDAYAEIIASPRGAGANENKEYTKMYVWCATNDALVSLDGGSNDHIRVPAGKEPLKIEGIKITQAIQAKNATGGSNYGNLTIIVW